MSYIYSMGKKAAVMSSADGKLYYALFEQTFDDNLHSSQPTWGSIAFGTAKDCMKKVVRTSAFCESGILMGANDQYPGSAEDAIRKIREAVEMKGSLPLDQNIVIYPGQIYDKWRKHYFVLAVEAALDGGIDPEKKAAYCAADGFSDALPVMDLSLTRLVERGADKYIHGIPIKAIHFPFLRGAESQPEESEPSNTP